MDWRELTLDVGSGDAFVDGVRVDPVVVEVRSDLIDNVVLAWYEAGKLDTEEAYERARVVEARLREELRSWLEEPA